jgi:SSS family solute:Na+ symporter
LSQAITFVIGGIALLLALTTTDVLDLMLQSYAFMVAGLLIPILGALYWRRRSPLAAGTAMLSGGVVTLFLQYWQVSVSAGMERASIIDTITRMKEYFPAIIKDANYESLPKNELIGIINNPKFIVIEPWNLQFTLPFGLDPLVFGIAAAALLFVAITWVFPSRKYSGIT